MTAALKKRAHRWFVYLSNPKNCGVDPDWDRYDVGVSDVRDIPISFSDYIMGKVSADNNVEMTYKEIAEELARLEGSDKPMTVERIRQIESGALRKLKHPSRGKRLAGFYPDGFYSIKIPKKGEIEKLYLESCWRSLRHLYEKGKGVAYVNSTGDPELKIAAYWGLAENTSYGQWQLTDKGVRFIEGEIEVPAAVYICDRKFIRYDKSKWVDMDDLMGVIL